MRLRGFLTAASLLAFVGAGAVALAQVRVEGPRVELDIPDRRPDPRTGADMVDLVGGLFALRDGYDRSRRGFICVLTYEDRNGNGRRDRGEGPLPGWSFAIADAAGATVAQGQTGKEGRFCNERPLNPGAYSVRQSPGGGWTNTEPGGPSVDVKAVTLPGEQSVTVLFGNCRGEGCDRVRRDEPREEPRGDTRAGPGDPTPQTSTTVCVRKFNDVNGNGFKQGFEPWLAGWQFILTWPTGAQTTMQATGTGGSCFTSQMPAGTYTLTETPQAGWLPTTPGGQTQTFTLTPGVPVTRIFGNRNLPWATAQLCVTKYNDLDGDGVRDAGEPLVPGWTFTVKTPLGGLLAAGATNAQGQWCATSLPIGPVEVHETPQAGWTTTDPAGTPAGQSPKKGLTLTPGQTASLVFGNRAPPPPSPKVCVTKYNDLNGNGVRDAGEPVLAGWFFEVRNLSGAPMGFGTTNAEGLWCSNTIIPPGPATVAEQPQTGWVNTDPGNAPAGTNPSKPVTLVAGQTVNLVFGNRVPPPPPPGQICVTKFNDLNGNGAKDASEPVLSGWTFTLEGVTGTTLESGVTNAQGQWCSSAPLPIGYPVSVVETQQAGWQNTKPGGAHKTSPTPTVILVLSPGQIANISFGNAAAPLPGQICVFKYRDDNRNLSHTVGEPPLAGWVFEIKNAAGVTVATGTTDAEGRWCSPAGLPPGAYKVFETAQAGWASMSPFGPAPWFRGVTLSTAGVQVSFGNVRAGRACFTKYHDLNGNGQRDAGEPSLPGWPIYVQSGTSFGTFTTDASGRACTGDLAPWSYHAFEVLPLPPGWVVTDPPALPPPQSPVKPFTIIEGQTTEVAFGNRHVVGRICVVKFKDTNGDGVKQANEPVLPNWLFTVAGSGMTQSGSTNELKGQWCTDQTLAPGAYTVSETMQPGWVSSTPGGTNPQLTATVVAGQTTTVMFGNRQLSPASGKVCIVKYNDIDGDGVRDAGEPALAGWAFPLRRTNGVPVGSITTAGAGGSGCQSLAPGAYVARETQQSGWTNTDPGSPFDKPFTIVSGQTVNLVFGNRAVAAPASLIVTKSKLTSGACHGSQPGANDCTFRFTVTNTGGTAYAGALSISDVVSWPGSPFPVTVVSAPPGWTCPSGPQSPVVCALGAASIPAGGSATYDIVLNLNAALPAQKNCVTLTWSGGQTPEACVQIFP